MLVVSETYKNYQNIIQLTDIEGGWSVLGVTRSTELLCAHPIFLIVSPYCKLSPYKIGSTNTTSPILLSDPLSSASSYTVEFKVWQMEQC
jgi:hypothetical protein